MTLTDFLYSIIIALLGGIGFFVKKILDRTDSIDSIRNDVSDMKPKIKILWEREFGAGASPLVLNERGKRIFSESGIKELVDARLGQLMEKLEERNPQNAYQVQECATKVMRLLVEDLNTLSRLQDGAFKTGVDVDTVLFVGGLYLRDLALPKYHFKLADVDRSEPKK